MALDIDTLTTAVREEIGNPITDEISDATIQRKLNQATRHINRSVSGSALKIGSFDTVAGQQAYTVPDAVTRVVDVFWHGNIYVEGHQFDTGWPYDHASSGSGRHARDLNFRSLSLISEMKVKQLRDIASFGYDWIIVDRQIYLDPYPTDADQTVYYFYTSASSDITSLEDQDEELVTLYAAAESLRILAATRANVGAVDREGMAAYTGARDLRMLADEKMKQFDLLLADKLAKGDL